MAVITESKVIKPRTGKTEIWLDGQRRQTVEPDTVVAYHLKKGMELDEARLEEIRAFDERLRARQALAGHTALTLRSCQQARAYLSRRGFGESVIDAVMTDAVERGWIDDERFAAAFIRRHSKLRPAGPRRLAADLAAKGVDPSAAESAIARFGPDEPAQRAHAEQIARKRLAAWQDRYDPPTLRRKLRDHLARQGYAPDLITEVVETLTGAEDELDA